jgi:next-to-BRCA1 protein 1
MEAAKAESRASQQKAELKKFEAEAKKKAKRIHYSGRFVKESITDKHQVTSGEKFTKEWTFRNDGETAWPMDTIFIQTNGDEMQACPAELTQEVPANSEHSWRLQLVAPEKAGRYTSYFRMATGDNKRFGHKVWCDIQVLEKPEPVKKVPVVPSLGLSDLPKVDEEMKVVEPAIKMVPQDEQIEEAKDKVEDSPLTFSSLMKTPKQAYFEQVLAEEDEALRAALI